MLAMLPLASNIVLPQQSQVRSILQQSLFEKNLYKNVLSEDGEKEIQKIKYIKMNKINIVVVLVLKILKKVKKYINYHVDIFFLILFLHGLKKNLINVLFVDMNYHHKEIKNEDYLIDISSNVGVGTNIFRNGVPINPFSRIFK